MKSRTSLTAINLFLVLALAISVLTGCSGSKNKIDTSKPPVLPPQSTFVMDFNDFTQNGNPVTSSQLSPSLFVSQSPSSISDSNGVYLLGDRSNWLFAALNVGFWNLAGVFGLAVPAASIVESVKQTPVKQSDNSWVWTFSITVQGVTYTAELHGKYISSGIRWDMFITKDNEYTDFLWYYGECNSNGTQGYWVLKEKPSKPDDLLRIDWHRNTVDETGDIKYTNIVSGGSENGGYISFTVSKNEPYNRAYVIFNKGQNETTSIEWNSSTKAGRVKDSVSFKDTDWHYWDSNLKNTTAS